MFHRILANSALFFSILFLPWWMIFVCALAALLVVRSFYEIIAWGFFADILYGGGEASLHGVPFLVSTGAIILFAVSRYIREETRLYE